MSSQKRLDLASLGLAVRLDRSQQWPPLHPCSLGGWPRQDTEVVQ
jgi:hypothetical protein